MSPFAVVTIAIFDVAAAAVATYEYGVWFQIPKVLLFLLYFYTQKHTYIHAFCVTWIYNLYLSKNI